MTICKQCFVSGRVQGVFYRDTTRQKAEKLQLVGYAKNLADGRVEVVICGSETNIDKLSEWLWTGSEYSSVANVHCQELELNEIELSNKFETM
ncbi:MAG: acylphosphatase [Gammaproteobacteria bacterium]|nr:acylphosphatase [Gammaproteobacteria bacterium]MCW9031720.1 acylphosphatase [Gammaproteobacteria bacterium]